MTVANHGTTLMLVFSPVRGTRPASAGLCQSSHHAASIASPRQKLEPYLHMLNTIGQRRDQAKRRKEKKKPKKKKTKAWCFLTCGEEGKHETANPQNVRHLVGHLQLRVPYTRYCTSSGTTLVATCAFWLHHRACTVCTAQKGEDPVVVILCDFVHYTQIDHGYPCYAAFRTAPASVPRTPPTA
ncbi:hypothetical protein GGI42DRAFT_182399 [Trichoderma sp. SZMC 28013]